MAGVRPFEELMAHLRQGDEEAAAIVWERFAHRLTALAATRLPGLLGAKVDPDDVVQSVFRTFFARQAGGQLDPESWDHLWTLLTVLTVRKCGHRVKHFRAARRDIRRESHPGPERSSATDWDVAAPVPTPAEAVLLAETLHQLLQELREDQRPIVLLRLQGYSLQEISSQVGCTERTVERVLKGVRERLQRSETDD
jgi:RNA polymerase sigma-70 factor (ECF subfamily)